MARSETLRLQDVYEASRNIESFIKGKNRSDLESDLMLERALVATITIIGEATKNISAEFKSSHPNVQWSAATGMRNHLVHGYYDVDLDILWETVTVAVPRLQAQLQPIISQLGLEL